MIVTSVNSIGRMPGRVVDREGDLGAAERGALGGAGEDDVVHLLAADRAGRLRAEHPGDGVDDVRLARPVGTDHDGDARLELQRRRVGERLETLEGERLQEHGCLDPSCRPRSDRVSPTSEQSGRRTRLTAAGHVRTSGTQNGCLVGAAGAPRQPLVTTSTRSRAIRLATIAGVRNKCSRRHSQHDVPERRELGDLVVDRARTARGLRRGSTNRRTR